MPPTRAKLPTPTQKGVRGIWTHSEKWILACLKRPALVHCQSFYPIATKSRLEANHTHFTQILT
jgi:hypothetical protein